jgi:hypothetical protein
MSCKVNIYKRSIFQQPKHKKRPSTIFFFHENLNTTSTIGRQSYLIDCILFDSNQSTKNTLQPTPLLSKQYTALTPPKHAVLHHCSRLILYGLTLDSGLSCSRLNVGIYTYR